ncbi:hypothetical protein SEUCBS139899_006195 [Sporothrix eucalyptigena]|uniref:Major facilitator superfamily (MFS) profile domain-containing protein n=1 Tax=Sporothrix eucalyptigena TaxID=1812306 RepID=A0ABP0AQE0_9PEZI
MTEIFRDTAVGMALRWITRNRVLLYPEEQPDFKIPELWQQMLNGEVDVAEDSDDTAAGGLRNPEKPVEQQSMFEANHGGDTTAHGSVADEENQLHENGPSSSSDDEKRGRGSKREDEGGDASGDNGPYAALRHASTHRTNGGGELHLHHTRSREETMPYTQERLDIDREHSIERTQSLPVVPKLVKTRTNATKSNAGDPNAPVYETAIVVDWYSTDDQANPQNWRLRRRIGVGFIIWLYTFCVYMSSAIYTNSEQGVMETFGVDATNAALGLSIFVLGYGTGPLIFSPLSEIPSIGRNPVYAVTMIFFVIFSLPASLAYGNLPGGYSSGNFGGFIVLRFLQGFFGSPCLASGAASLGDMFSLLHLPYALAGWVSAGFSAPALGPLLSGFSVPAKGWRWSMLEILWAAVPCTIVMLAFLPETSAPNILLRRARRLRKATGSDRFRAPSEVADYNDHGEDGKPKKTARQKAIAVLVDALIKPIEITIKDPAVLFVQVYSAIVYGIYYSFFEAFPLVYPVKYGMSAGEVGLVFTCILVACIIGVTIYCLYVYFILNKKIAKTGQFPPNEDRLIPAMFAAFGPTFGLFIFGWTAEHAPQVPWIAPTIGITLYGATVFVVLQCIFVYIPLSYPMYAASLFAANDFFRSALATGSVLFGRPLFMNLGIGRGTSVLGGLSTIGIVGIWLLYFYGARLRAMSKFAI